MLNELFITLTVCIDTYLMSVNYNSSGIKIPFRSGLMLSFISSLILYLSLLFAGILELVIPLKVCSVIGCITLTAIGTVTIFKSIVRGIVRKLSQKGYICIRMSRLGIAVRLYLDERTADSDYSKVLSISESFALALALSADSVAVGINAGFLGANPVRTAFFTFIVNIVVVYLGALTGKKFFSSEYDLSWLGGFMLILSAVISLI